ncbi:Ribosomal RNA large subunit methyltransferase [Trichinella spiralis]|uniref:Ribosomal RNA large subunit methyltransferase n=1 Tax=Trichinella spiralis TaxID=6334 RepID=A0ABR3KKM1_TRISP
MAWNLQNWQTRMARYTRKILKQQEQSGRAKWWQQSSPDGDARFVRDTAAEEPEPRTLLPSHALPFYCGYSGKWMVGIGGGTLAVYCNRLRRTATSSFPGLTNASREPNPCRGRECLDHLSRRCPNKRQRGHRQPTGAQNVRSGDCQVLAISGLRGGSALIRGWAASIIPAVEDKGQRRSRRRQLTAAENKG